jgi:hypothetical protein
MPSSKTRWLGAALVLLASGCLLPQPDTPPVPPGAAPDSSARAGAAPQVPTGAAMPQTATGMAESPSPTPSPSPSPSPGTGATQVAPIP